MQNSNLSTNEKLRLSTRIAEQGPLPRQEVLEVLLDIAQQVQALHAAGRIHRGIDADAVLLDQPGRAILGDPQAECRIDAAAEDRLRFPLELRSMHGLAIPGDLAAAQEVLRQHRISIDARQIDLFALGALFCRLLTGKSVDDYLRRPEVKGSVPADLQLVIEQACGLDGGSQACTAASFVQLLRNRIAETQSFPQSDPSVNGPADASAVSGAMSAPLGTDAPPVQQDTAPSIVSGIAQPETDAGPVVAAASNRTRDELPFQRLGHYDVVARIGHGGMGDVFQGYERGLDRTVALKVLPVELARHADFVSRFRAEATAAAKLIHPGVVQIYFIGEEGGHHYFAMQFVEGESLAQRLTGVNRLSIEETLDIIEQVLSALAAAHNQGLIHRDIKPGNILLDRPKRRALLADFGLVKVLESPGAMTTTGVIMGTVDYISPEQGRGRDVDGRSDLYSLGVLMYQMLSGRLPFEADSPTAMIFQHAYEPPRPLGEVAEVPSPLAAIVHRLLAKSPEERYQTAADTLTDVRAFRDGRPLLPVARPRSASGTPASGSLPSGRPSMVITAPQPAELLPVARAMGDGWWGRFRQRLADAFAQQAPELLQRLQNTQQQVDGAIGEYERRVRDLSQLEHDAEQVLGEFLAQARAGEDAAKAAAARVVGSADAQAVEQARQEQERCERSSRELREQAVRQQAELEPMQRQLGQVRAVLAQLTSQRDVLQARLKAAQARAHVYGSARPVSRRRRHYLIGAAVVLATAGLLALFLFTGSQSKTQTVAKQVFPVIPGSPAVKVRAVDDLELAAHAKPVVPLQQLLGHSKIVWCVAFNSDGKLLASASEDRTVRIWDVATGKEVKKFSTDENAGGFGVGALAFSADGKTLAAAARAHEAGLLRVWEIESGRQLIEIEKSAGDITAAVFHPAEPILATAHKADIQLWSVGTGQLLGSLGRAAFDVQRIAFSSDGRLLAAGGGLGQIAVWDVVRKAVVESLADAGAGALAFGPGGKTLAASQNGRVAVWDLFEGRPPIRYDAIVGPQQTPAQQTPAQHTPHSLAFSPDGSKLAGSCESSTLVWDLNVGQIRGVLPGEGVLSVAFSPDGTRIATGGRDPFLVLWNAHLSPFTVSRAAHTLKTKAKETLSLAAIPGSEKMLVGGSDLLALWDLKAGKEVRAFPVSGQIIRVAVSPDGSRAISGAYDGTVTYWDLTNGKELRKLDMLAIRNAERGETRTEMPIRHVALLPGGREALVVGGGMFLWDLKNGAEIDRFTHFSGMATALSPDGRHVVTGGYDGPRRMGDLRLFDVATGEELRRFVGHAHYVWSLAFTPDSKRLLSGGSGSMHLWDVETAKELRRYLAEGFQKNVAISPDSRHAVSGDRTIRVWDLESSEEILRFYPLGGTAEVTALSFTTDGKRVVSTAKNGMITIWNLNSR